MLLDTYSLFFRAYHALPAMCTSRGEPTSALFGLSALLIKLLREHRPAGLAFALDAPTKTFRHEQFAAYKGTRESAPSPLVAQLERLDQLLVAFGVPAHRVPGYEADDVLATLARHLSRDGARVLIVSGDRDLLQVVSPLVHVSFVGRRGKDAVLYDADAVQKRFGLAASALPSYVAMVGDVSDNLPKVPGIGPKTATALVKQHGTVSALLEHIEDVLPQRLRAIIATHADQLRLNEQLARLRDDVPLASDAPLAAMPSTKGMAALRELFVKLEFKSLVPRLDALEKTLDTSS
jgi:DNA polymerase I